MFRDILAMKAQFELETPEHLRDVKMAKLADGTQFEWETAEHLQNLEETAVSKSEKAQMLKDLAAAPHEQRLSEMGSVFQLRNFDNLRNQDDDFTYKKEELSQPLMMYTDLDDVSPRAGWLHCFGSHSNRDRLIHPARGRFL